MSIILAGPNNKVVMAAPGRPMLAAPLPGTVPITVVTTSLTAVAGLTGWWDAGTAAGVLSPAGTPLTAFGATAGSVADKSGVGAALTV